jgi:hypothetical protein
MHLVSFILGFLSGIAAFLLFAYLFFNWFVKRIKKQLEQSLINKLGGIVDGN